jgi:hypothetical protein
MAQDRAETMKTSERASLLLGLAFLFPFAMASMPMPRHGALPLFGLPFSAWKKS